MAVLPVLQSAVPPVEFDAAPLRKLAQQGPRYTSYPTADRFSDDFRPGDYLQAVSSVRAMGARNPLSLYVHIPFCDTVCFYCACNKIITKNRARADTYLTYLKREIEMQGRLFAGMSQVEQLHFGGGTPTYLSDAQMGELFAHLRRWFRFATDDQGEYSIEIDPRTVDAARIHSLRSQGFNRISLGVQDYDADVQQAVNRIQPEEKTQQAIDAARDAGFRSISIDLIYGLPKQSAPTMEQTLRKVIVADPDRISIYNYAHLPQLFKSQRHIIESELPNAETKLEMLSLCIDRLTAAGYVYIGMDHFAKPMDELAVAQRQGRLHRNFQGYSTHAEAEMVSCGVSAISAVGGTYSRNEKTLDAYYERIEQGELPIARGIKLTTDDLLRRIIIQMLMCNFELSIAALEMAYPITFTNYFVPELEKLRAFVDDGLVSIDAAWLTVTPKGRLLIRNICMVFDRYLGSAKTAGAERARFSQTI
jgi:oxygen-independent coproporphyrinogen III oxidase